MQGLTGSKPLVAPMRWLSTTAREVTRTLHEGKLTVHLPPEAGRVAKFGWTGFTSTVFLGGSVFGSMAARAAQLQVGVETRRGVPIEHTEVTIAKASKPPTPGIMGFPMPAKMQERKTYSFDGGALRFDNKFEGARLSNVWQVRPGEFVVRIDPENEVINSSPWFAFGVESEVPRTIEIRFRYSGSTKSNKPIDHRYIPKISRDGGQTWGLASDEDFDLESAFLRLELSPGRTLVAAQEIITNQDVRLWMSELARHPDATACDLDGLTPLGNRIGMVEITSNPDAPYYVVLIGGQHPAEVPGLIARQAFTETLLADTPLAQQFRSNFKTIVIPRINPDGAQMGHFRNNMKGSDPNRTWGDTPQPEVELVMRELQKLLKQGRVVFAADFHATRTENDQFRVPKDEYQTRLPQFYNLWLDLIEEALDRDPMKSALPKRLERPAARSWYEKTVPSLDIRRSKITASVARNWMLKELETPAVTVEAGDTHTRTRLRRVHSISAEAMMKTLIDFLNGGELADTYK